MVRGDVHEYQALDPSGREQSGRRFCVIVQAPHLLPSSTVLVAPTSSSARELTYRPRVRFLNRSTTVLIEQIRATDSSRLGRRVGRLSVDELWSINDAIKDVFGLM
ncbi:MAG: type II toxin-antitoxin system PemK/MazF family toxin [Actinomycetota bacterium]